MDAQDVRMRNTAGKKQLVFKPLQGLGIGHQIGSEDLDGYGAVQFAIAGFVNFTHAAGPEKRLDVITRTKIGAGIYRSGIRNLESGTQPDIGANIQAAATAYANVSTGRVRGMTVRADHYDAPMVARSERVKGIIAARTRESIG